ncbi:MAG TPA: hypothetical protein VIM77_14360, partial [Mucilaginibacter sp.]
YNIQIPDVCCIWDLLLMSLTYVKLNIGTTVRHLDRARRVAGRLPPYRTCIGRKKLKMELNAKNGTYKLLPGMLEMLLGPQLIRLDQLLVDR